ncbi:MAG: hypothetical protein ACOZAN_04175 [Patescibacteria group bacterium]
MKKNVLRIIGKILLLLAVPLVIAFAALFIPFNEIPLFKWKKLPPLPQGLVIDVLDVDIIPMGHIDEVYVLNDSHELFVWNKKHKYSFDGGSWRKVASLEMGLIKEIVSDHSYPVDGVYGKSSDGTIYSFDADSNKWEKVDTSSLPNEKNHSCSPWPKLPISEQRVVERFELCFQGSMSEEHRYYIRTIDL